MSGIDLRTWFPARANTFNTLQTFAPTAGIEPIKVVIPAQASGFSGLRVTDRSSEGGGGDDNASTLLRVEHEGSENAVDIFNWPAATNLALAVHNYSGDTNAAQFDNTADGHILTLANTQNGSASPGTHGTGRFLRFIGYSVAGVTRAVGVVTGGNTLTDDTTPAAWTAEDVGKTITVAAVTTTIATRVSATQITTTDAIVNGSGVTYNYAPTAGDMMYIDELLQYTLVGTRPMTIRTAAGASRCLDVSQGSGSLDAVTITNAGTGKALSISSSGDVDVVSANKSGTGAGQVYTVTDNGTGSTISLQKNGTPAAGRAALSLGTTLGAIDMVRVNDSGGAGRALIRADGQLALGVNYPTVAAVAAKLQVEFAGTGFPRTMALTNNTGADANGVQIEMDVAGTQFAFIQGTRASGASGHGDIRLHARVSNTMRELARVDGSNDRLAVFRQGFALTDSTSRIDFLHASQRQTTVGSAGAGSALPATPEGYIKVLIAGAEKVVPYYAAS